MSRFFESIKLFDGTFYLLDLHADRVNKTIKHFFGEQKIINLSELLIVPEEAKKGLFKVKVIYSNTIESVEYQTYTIKNHAKIKLLKDNLISYKFKDCVRTSLERDLILDDEIDDVIFIKNGKLTDASYSNIILFGQKKWWTPKSCLFQGVKRTSLISNKMVFEKDIKAEDIMQYEKIGFINAMRDFEKIYSFKIDDNILNLSPLK
jgi:4-amino-4-deoxychorismate lyase